jgi:hypothetical protein
MSLSLGITKVTGNLGGAPVNFYNIPIGFVMFKGLPNYLATTYEAQPQQIELVSSGIGSYFFALPSDDPTYIESLEDMYGVVYEYQTTRPFQLLAMDDYATVGVLYSGAPENVQSVLSKNYGYFTGKTQLGPRISDPDTDAVLVNYLKTIKLGYAILNINTAVKFHPELFFCNITRGEITCNRMVTTKARYKIVEEAIKMRLLGEKLGKKKKPRSDGSPPHSPPGIVFNPFADGAFSSPVKGAGGGAVKLSYDSAVKGAGGGGFSYDSPSGRGGKRKRTKKTTNRKKRKPKKRTSRKK